MNVTYEDVRKSEEIRTYIKQADESLKAIGYTEHSFAHCTKVAKVAGDLLEKLGYDAHEVELARIAGFMHDIGNVVNRIDHAQSGAMMAFVFWIRWECRLKMWRPLLQLSETMTNRRLLL